MELDFAPAYKSWNACEPIELFTAPVVKVVPKVRLGVLDFDESFSGSSIN